MASRGGQRLARAGPRYPGATSQCDMAFEVLVPWTNPVPNPADAICPAGRKNPRPR